MPRYTYQAKDVSGNRIKGELEVADERSLIKMLREKNLVPSSIVESIPKKSFGFNFSFGPPVPLSEIVIFSRQLATMIQAGIPILQALEILSEQTDHKKFKVILKDVAKRVASGSSIFQAMSKYEDVFSEFFVHIVKAGEESGNLDEILDRVAIYLEKSEKITRKVKSALVYPAVVISMAIAITGLMIVKVIPVFVEMYSDFDLALPLPTQILIQTSAFVRANLLWIGLGAAGTVFGLRQFGRTSHGGYVLDSVKLKLPIFGVLLQKVAVSRFSRTMSTLLKSGVPILRAMEVVAKTSGNKVLEKAIADSSQSVREGRKISVPLKKTKIFPPMVIRMIAIGETTGELETMLTKVADFYDDQVDAAVSSLTSIIEPLIIGFLGIVIGGIVVSMFLPMFGMITAIGT